MTEEKLIDFIKKHSKKLHQDIGALIDAYIMRNELDEDTITLNIVFNALSNNIQAIVEQNHDIPGESVELMIEALSKRLRKAYQSRIENQN